MLMIPSERTADYNSVHDRDHLMLDVSENNVLKEFGECMRAWITVFADMHHGSASI